MSSYDSYLASAQQSAKKQQEEYQKLRNQQLQQTIASLTAAATAQQNALKQTHSQQSTATKNSYEALFDRNAISEAIARKTVAERMANLGLTDSGLNRTQQTAIATTRAKADAKTALQQQEALDLLASQLATALADSNSTLVKNKADATDSAQADIQNNLSTLMKLATEQAGDRYDTDVTAQTAAQKMQADIQKAQIEAQAKVDAAKASSAKNDELAYIQTFVELLQDRAVYQAAELYTPYQMLLRLLRQRIFGQ